jgi:hypothetical protein
MLKALTQHALAAVFAVGETLAARLDLPINKEDCGELLFKSPIDSFGG